MLGVDNYIVKSDDLGKLTKNVKVLDINENNEKCNKKNDEVWQIIRNDCFHFGGRKNFVADFCVVIAAQATKNIKMEDKLAR